jgi:conjugative relaxase-like TrwC/TraI family protein
MVGVTKIQRGNAGYWLAAVAQGGEDYYTKPGEAPGEWVGSLAEELGLFGEVDAAGYSAILEGRDPGSGAQLLARPDTSFRIRPDGSQKRVEPVLGHDVRFSAPKSVSLLYALGDDALRAEVVSIVEEAVRAGMAHLEAEACVVGRGEGGKDVEPGTGLVGMAFRHRMSRAGDPALHVHVVVSNMTRAAKDGKWMSLASPKGKSPFWLHAKSAGVVFQAVLRARFLERLGLEFEDVTNGYADLKGISREQIDAFSTRSQEIASWLEAVGFDSIAAAQVAAYKTRANKDYGVSVDQRTAEWVEQAEPLGLTPAGVAEMASAGAPRSPSPIGEDAIEAAISQLEETRSHFDDRALLWAIADQLPEGASLEGLSSAAERASSSERVVCLHSAKSPMEQSHYTTLRIFELEQEFKEGALAGRGAGAAVVAPAHVDAALAAHPHLGEEQRQMVLRLTTGGDKVSLVNAWPGTGKTTALAAAREAWEAAGFPVVGCATARTASGELKSAGVVPSLSIASLRFQAAVRKTERGASLPPGTVILADESSMTSTPDLEALRQLAIECGGKLVLIGDDRQIGAVGPGGLFVLMTRVMEASSLTRIHRQPLEPDRQLVALIHEGRGAEGLDLLRGRDRLIVGDDLHSTLAGLLADWSSDFATGADVVMIARRNRDVELLNHGARELRAEQGALGEAEVLVGERPFAAGDRVLTRHNAPGVDNRERWDVVAADAAARTLRLRRVGGDEREVVLGPRYLDRATPKGEAALQHAYAITSFGAQSKTFDRAYPFLDPGADLEEQLVAMSRGREVANAYLVAAPDLLDPDFGPGGRDVEDTLEDLREAIEHEGADHAASEVALREEIEGLGPLGLAQRRAQLQAATDLALSLERGEEALVRLRHERAELEAMKQPPPAELAQARAAEERREQRLAADRAALAKLLKADPAGPLSIKPRDRLEASLVERRIEVNARREVALARLGESEPIYRALGPFPADGEAALAWGQAAHAAALYRQRHGVNDEHRLLGERPSKEKARAEHDAARRRVEAARAQLEWPRDAEQAPEAVRSIGR